MTIHKTVSGIIDETCKLMSDGLAHYWPVINAGVNGLQEANLTYHFAAECLRRRMHVYPEASHGAPSNGHRRFDLLVIDPNHTPNTTFIVETKKLFSSGKAREIVDDIDKILSFERAISSTDKASIPLEKRVGVLLAITQREDVAEWWCDPYPYGSGWDRLRDKLIVVSAKMDCKTIEGVLIKQHILYATFDVPEKHS
jgi:hypothetical protein